MGQTPGEASSSPPRSPGEAVGRVPRRRRRAARRGRRRGRRSAPRCRPRGGVRIGRYGSAPGSGCPEARRLEPVALDRAEHPVEVVGEGEDLLGAGAGTERDPAADGARAVGGLPGPRRPRRGTLPDGAAGGGRPGRVRPGCGDRGCGVGLPRAGAVSVGSGLAGRSRGRRGGRARGGGRAGGTGRGTGRPGRCRKGAVSRTWTLGNEAPWDGARRPGSGRDRPPRAAPGRRRAPSATAGAALARCSSSSETGSIMASEAAR